MTAAPTITFTVTMRFQFPAWDEKDGIPFTVRADSKAKAVQYARRQAYDDGHLCGGKGRVSFKATPEETNQGDFQ